MPLQSSHSLTCAIIVPKAAPRAPMPKGNMNAQSSMQFRAVKTRLQTSGDYRR